MSEDDSNSSLDMMEVEPGVVVCRSNVPSVIHPHNVSSVHLNGQRRQMNQNPRDAPYVEIIEQPKSRGFRFRYACEGKSHGGLQGANGSKSKKTSPSIRIQNYIGLAKIVVKLVTDEIVPKPHAHELIGKNCNDGICSVEVKPEKLHSEITFPNLGILHVTRKNVVDILRRRIMEEMQVAKMREESFANRDMNHIPLSDEEKKTAAIQAKEQAKTMQLNVVKLCFQVYLADERGLFSRILPSVVSQSIYDCKSPGAAALKICRMDRHSGCCIGNDEVFLLCDKVQKEDIAVQFFEQNENGDMIWEAQGSFGPADVHRQYAIVFRTPAYKDTNIDKPVNVFVQLKRLGDGESSHPKPFTYIPQPKDQDEVQKKKAKAIPYFNNEAVGGSIPHSGFALITSAAQFLNGGRGGSIQTMVPQTINGVVQPYIQIPQQQAYGMMGPSSLPGSMHSAQNIPHTGATVLTTTQVDQKPFMMHARGISNTSPTQQQQQPNNVTMQARSISYSPPTQQLNAIMLQNGASSNDRTSQMNGVIQNGIHYQTSPSRKRSQGAVECDIEEDSCPYDDDDLDRECKPTSDWSSDVQFHPSINSKLESGYQSYTQSIEGNLTSGLLGGPNPSEHIRGANAELSFQQGMVSRDMPSVAREAAGPIQQLVYDDINIEEVSDIYKGKQEVSKGTTDNTTELSVDTEDSLRTTSIMDTNRENDTIDNKTDEPTVVIVNPEQEVNVVKLETVEVMKAENESTTKAEDELTQDCMEMLAFRVAENTALALQEFAKSGNIAYLLVIQRHLVAVQDENGDNSLHMAVIHRRVEPIRHLLLAASSLQDNVAVNAYNVLQQTPLHLSVITNQPEIVELLVKYNADISLVDRNGNTAAHVAALNGFDRCLQGLLSGTVTRYGKTGPMASVDHLNYDGFSALHLAVIHNQLSCVRHLIRNDCDVNLADGKSGYTALHHATETENLGIVGYLLLEAIADPNIPAYNANTPLHIAVGRDLLGVAALLVASGADAELENAEAVCSDSEGDSNEYNKLNDTTAANSEEACYIEGITPLDMAQGNPNMLKILRGESYSSVSEHKHLQSGNKTLYSGLMESGLGIMSPDGDLDKLDLVTRMKLTNLLDKSNSSDVSSGQSNVQHNQGDGWERLAEITGLSSLIPALRGMKTPTRALLDNLEVLDCTISKLKDALVQMKRSDAIEVIDEGLSLHQQAQEFAERQAKDPLRLSQQGYMLESSISNLSIRSQHEQ